ncbi:hypothetical protein KXQ82_15975 [Mucilaginibacter sp. HMF5004]|uniref:M56 family metallopeptidase n=1 Tax=Mucilaginibacter rivuli TaxID=2857527 RepID=UPI001C5FDD70|nr:M56 family metallopeptidase [Mucilaginibacter rivuli]MBW4891225.1 hypothetical protein [Mucilaginibacter rivuli]
MMLYLAKFIACSGLLLAVYHLLLKNKAMYRFNRAFLLAGIVFSLAVPFIQFEQHVVDLPQIMPVAESIAVQAEQPAMAIENDKEQTMETKTTIAQPIVSVAPVNKPVNYLLIISLSIYGIVTALLLFRFLRNLYKIRTMTTLNEHVDYNEAEVVLIPQRLIPHSFFKYIFLNRDDFHGNKIEDKILHHELAHTRQYHSADVVFIELVQVFCWFNPLLILYRKAIQLNHEFLADEAVLNTYTDVISYQHLLLKSLSMASGLSVTSQFNYSLTKKRLIMMTKTTSKKTAVLSKVLTFAVMSVVFVLFCNATVLQQQSTTKQKSEPEKITYAIGQPMIPVIAPLPKKDTNKIHFPKPYPSTKEGVSQQMLDEYSSIIEKYENKWGNIPPRERKIEPADKDRMIAIYRQMSPEQQAKQVIMFHYGYPLQPSVKPTQAQLNAFANAHVYGVWIDEKKVPNNEISKYTPADFGAVAISTLTPRAVNYKRYRYEVILSTVKYNEAFRRGFKGDEFKDHMWIKMSKVAGVKGFKVKDDQYVSAEKI